MAERYDDDVRQASSCEAAEGELGGDPRLHALASEMSRSSYDAWIAPLELRSESGGGVQVVAPDPEHRQLVRAAYGDLLERALGVRPSYYTRPYNRGRG